MAAKSKVLVIGGTGYIGKFIVEASAKSSRPTFTLLRESTLSNPAKAKIVEGFKSLGVNLVRDRDRIVVAIKAAGNIKRFLPSEFGNDVDRVHAVEPAKSAFAIKAKIRHLVEAEGIPYTYVSDKVVILRDENVKAVFNKEDDIGAYTIKAVDDPRTLNKILYIRLPANTYSFNDLVSLWERKIGKTLERVYVSEEKVLKNIQEVAVPFNVILAISHSIFVKEDHTNFEIESSFGVEASELYLDVKYTTVD
ncbi:hypothetical protein EUGRSUZ_B01253 [Eucalyptus grandis]|uniref:Uncharacterized protein n=2 Tax=Eucalyptus grandis TaxID=71139 RepID=A0ACC3LRD9_EUCGR|nr:hypothetical protein EUGRSUZ_B01253 [Eucalyptus grandis]